MPIERSLQQLLITNFALSPSGYVGSRGDIGYTGSAAAGGGGSAGPKITAITYPGDDTAANTAGGDTITITGTGFASGASVIINGLVASVVSFVNSTTITFTAPALAAGSYIVYVVNTDGGTALAVPGIQYSGTPAWTTAAGSLGTYNKQTSFTANLLASGDAPVTYSVYSGSLPSGLTLSANTGVISGTTPNLSVDTTYNFTIRSTDAQRQDTDRAFSITIAIATPPTAVEYLVVAGGGGGGGSYGGGGGAGGYRTATGFAVSSGVALTVTVGGGGAAGSASPNSPTNYGSAGTNSVFSSIVSTGGGGGSSYPGASSTQINGGSGGGGGSGSGALTGGTGIAGQGYNGGTPAYGAGYSAAGGGGAGAAGSPTINQYDGGAGGTGAVSSISGTATYYAGGGGGSGYLNAGGNGGAGGGGAGGKYGPPHADGVAGTANTGGGGGGTTDQVTGKVAGAGGSGIVIVRYADTYQAAASTTGSPTITVAGGYRVYKWTTSGSITF